MEKIVEFSHVSVEFPGVRANDDVSFSVNKGEIFALVGENGAGKSTLMNVLFGLYQPTEGSIYIHGKKVRRQLDQHFLILHNNKLPGIFPFGSRCHQSSFQYHFYLIRIQ